MADGEKGRGSMWTWVAVGCGGFVLLGVVGMCVGPGIFAMMMMDGLAGMGPGMGPMPPGTIEPGTAGLELPPAEGPLMPVGVNAQLATAQRTWAMVITDTGGQPGLEVGDVCPFEVERLQRGGGSYWCRTEVSCDGAPLYGGPGQGYFDCTFPETEYDRFQAYDYGAQSDDGDASFVVDYDGTITIRNEYGDTFTVMGRLEEAPDIGVTDDDPLANETGAPTPPEPVVP